VFSDLLSANGTILYQGPDSEINDVVLSPGSAQDNYFVCIIVRIADSQLSYTFVTVKIKVRIV